MLRMGDSQTIGEAGLNAAVDDAKEKDHGRPKEMDDENIPGLW